jgi:hypothetical protein
MASTYSTDLRLELIGSGEQSGVWGSTTNLNLGELVEQAIAGVESIVIPSSNYALETFYGAVDESRNAVLVLSSGAAANVYVPPVDKVYVVKNIGSFTITMYNSTVVGNTTAAGTGVAVAAGTAVLLFTDGSDFSAAGLPTGASTGTGNIVFSASPTLTGTPLAPTASAGTNTTQIATTAFVNSAVNTATAALGTMSTQNASAVTITGGSITGITDLAIADGGTGASTAANARTNLGLGTLATQSAVTAAQVPSGSVVQTQYAQYTSSSSGGSSWGDTGITVNITPSSTSNKVLVKVCFCWSSTDGTATLWRLVRNGTVVGAGSSSASLTLGMDSYERGSIFSATFEYLDSPSSTSALTYKLQGIAPNGGNQWLINVAQFPTTMSGYTSTSSITVQEIVG